MSFNYCSLNDCKMWLAGVDVSEMPSSLDQIIEQNYIPWAKRQIDTYIGQNLDLTTVTEYYDGNGKIELILNHRPVNFVRECSLFVIPSVQWYTFRRWFNINTVDILGTKVADRGGVQPNAPESVAPYTFPEGSLVPLDMISATPTADFLSTEHQYGQSDLFVNNKLGILSIPPRIMYLESQGIPFWNYTWLKGYGNIKVTYDYGYVSYEVLPTEVKSAAAQLVAAAVLKTKGQFVGSGAVSLNVGPMSKSYGEMPYGNYIKAYIEGAKQTLNVYKQVRV